MRCEGYMLVTKDIQEARRFYASVIGAEITLDLERHVAFREGFSLLHESDWRVFAELEDSTCAYRHHTGQLVFEVDDIDAFLRHMESFPSLELLHQAKEHPWGRRAVRFYDPDGHVIEVGESMKVVVERFLRNGLSVEEAAQKSEFPVAFVRRCKEEMGNNG